MRIALIDRPSPADRPVGANRFSSLAQLLERQGHEVLLHEGAPASPAEPILTALNRAGASAPMIEANALAHHLAGLKPDLVIGPLRGGILHGILMARACGEAFTTSRIAVWCDTPSHTRFMHEDDLPSGLAPLIADALERQVVLLADAILLQTEAIPAALSGWERRGALLSACPLPLPGGSRSTALSSAPEVEEIVFPGPFRRHAGVVEFIAVMERLADDGSLAGRVVTFLGAARSLALGVGRDWLGFRAARWSFPFKVVEAIDAGERPSYLTGPGRLAVVIAHDADDLLEVRNSGAHHIGLLWGNDGSAHLADRLEQAVRDAFAARPIGQPGSPDAHWPTLVDQILALPLPARRVERGLDSGGVTVCVVHHNRLGYLTEALATIPDRLDGQAVELLIIDNASDIALVENEIRKAAGVRDALRVIRFEKPVSQAVALNHGVKEARHEAVLFLDDDNSFTPEGVKRLADAMASDDFDIVVSALEIFDDGAPGGVGRLVFLGAAHSAGLFFNGFGDTAMAVRRDAFLELGGFHDPGLSGSHLDWITLAKAQSTGLRIGALQWPAVRYRRNTDKADLAANKIDQEGARRFVFEAYDGAFDAKLVARYAQKLQLDEL